MSETYYKYSKCNNLNKVSLEISDIDIHKCRSFKAIYFQRILLRFMCQQNIYLCYKYFFL